MYCLIEFIIITIITIISIIIIIITILGHSITVSQAQRDRFVCVCYTQPLGPPQLHPTLIRGWTSYDFLDHICICPVPSPGWKNRTLKASALLAPLTQPAVCF